MEENSFRGIEVHIWLGEIENEKILASFENRKRLSRDTLISSKFPPEELLAVTLTEAIREVLVAVRKKFGSENK